MAIIRRTPENILTSQDPGLEPVRQTEDRKVIEELNYNPANPLSIPSNYVVNQVTQVISTVIQNYPPQGANGQIQINENGQLVGDTGLTYEPTTDTLTTGTINAGNIHVTGVANLGNVNTLVIEGGNIGDVLTTNGSGLVHWANVYPSISGQSGKFLVTDGINVNWSNIFFNTFATTTDVSNAIGNLINSAPTALDTLGELANALGNSGNFTISIVNQLANKVNSNALALVATSGNFSDLNYKPNLSDYLPSQSSNTGKYLTTNGTNASWATVPAAQIQSDWTQTDNTQKDYIKNKPTLVTNLDSLSDVVITSATNGQVLKFNGTNWINGTDNAGTGGSSYDQDLNTTDDVTFANITLTGKVIAKQDTGTNGGYSFGGDEGGNDTGMFSGSDGVLDFYSNDEKIVTITTDSVELNRNITSNGLEIYTNEGSGGSIDIYTDWTGTGTSGGIDLWLTHDEALYIKTNDGDFVWTFDKTGNLTLPAGGDILDSTGTSVLGGGASTGNITFDGDNIGSTNDIVNIIGNNYAELQSHDNYIWVEENDAAVLVNDYQWTFHDNAVLELANGANISQTTDEGGHKTFNITPQEVSDFEVITIDGNIRLQTANSDGGITTSIWTFDKDGNLTLPGGGVLGDAFNDGGLTLKSPAFQYVELGSYDGNTYAWIADREYYAGEESSFIIGTDYTGDDNRWKFSATGSVSFPSGAGFSKGESGQLKVNDSTTSSLDLRDSGGRGFYTNNDGVTLRSNGSQNWYFGYDGITTLPGAIHQNYTTTKGRNYLSISSGTTSDIWVAEDLHMTSVKLTVQIESRTGSPYYDNFDTMTCEIVMAKKKVNGTYTAAPITVYGIVHTSADPLATFSSRIITTPGPDLGKAVLTCTPDASITHTCFVRVHSVEMFSSSVQDDF
jgi:hypothetical protein